MSQSSVLLNDVALRNFLITDTNSLTMIDFGQCEVCGLGRGIIQASADWMEAGVDIFQLGCAVYSISIWERFETEVPDAGACLNSLPSTEGLAYGSLIQKCWKDCIKTWMKSLLTLRISMIRKVTVLERSTFHNTDFSSRVYHMVLFSATSRRDAL